MHRVLKSQERKENYSEEILKLKKKKKQDFLKMDFVKTSVTQKTKPKNHPNSFKERRHKLKISFIFFKDMIFFF